MGSQERGGGSGDRETILARRAMFVASALGGLGLAVPRVAEGQQPAEEPAPALSGEHESEEHAPQICLSITPTPERPRRGLLAGLTSEFWLPLDALGEDVGRPPYALGASLQVAYPMRLSGSFEVRAAVAAGFLASTRGSMLPAKGELQLMLTTLPGGFSALILGGGWLLGLAGNEQAAGEWRPIPGRLFAEGSMVPFGFRFGRENRGELGLRFGAIYARVGDGQRERGAFAFVSSGAWLTYLF